MWKLIFLNSGCSVLSVSFLIKNTVFVCVFSWLVLR